ncbi:hypothetical protein BDQ17DRAFT_1260183 [Cyathus striatus]|nr:hypothetical protein BDQ17DRAFT_1260183 [Cyathus striatus]
MLACPQPNKEGPLIIIYIPDQSVAIFAQEISVPTQWDAQQINEWNTDLCLLMVACNIPWQAVENPVWRHFFYKWVPGCIIPGRKLLSSRILDEQAELIVDNIRKGVKGRYGAGQCDGWKNISKDSLIGSMVNVKYQPYLIGTTNVSAQAKNAENLLEIVKDDIKYCVDILGIKLVGWCTDSSGESLKMRRLLVSSNSWMVVVECWAHQVLLPIAIYLIHHHLIFDLDKSYCWRLS